MQVDLRCSLGRCPRRLCVALTAFFRLFCALLAFISKGRWLLLPPLTSSAPQFYPFKLEPGVSWKQPLHFRVGAKSVYTPSPHPSFVGSNWVVVVVIMAYSLNLYSSSK